jgi:hypothetical protein
MGKINFNGTEFETDILYKSGEYEYALFQDRGGLAVMHHYTREPKRIPRAEYLEEGFKFREELINLRGFRLARVPQDLVAVLGGMFLDDFFNRWLEDIGILDRGT